MNAIFETLRELRRRKWPASVHHHSDTVVSAIHAPTADTGLREELTPTHSAHGPDWSYSAGTVSNLREQLARGIRYFHIAEPDGVGLVAARSARQAQALYFHHVKDTLWGGPEDPQPYFITEIHAREATPEDMAGFRTLRIVPAKRPIAPCVLKDPIRSATSIAAVRSPAARAPGFHC